GHQRLSGAIARARPEGREEPIRRRLLPLRPPLAQRLPQGTGVLVLALLDEDAVALAPQLGERAAGGAGREVAWVGAEAEAQLVAPRPGDPRVVLHELPGEAVAVAAVLRSEEHTSD